MSGTEDERRPRRLQNEVRPEDGPVAWRQALESLPARPGLCGRCRHARILTSPKSAFVRCGLAAEDPRFPRYPPLPVTSCTGYEPADPGEGTLAT